MVDSHLDIFAPFSCGLVSFIFMMFVFIGSGWRSLRLVVLVFEGCLGLHGGVLLFIVGCLFIVRSLRLVVLFFEECLKLTHGGVLLYGVELLFIVDRYNWSYWFSKNVSNFAWWCGTLHCRLLVIVQSLRLVILFFEECLKLTQGCVTLL